jgi:RNA-directed DNA polymerase
MSETGSEKKAERVKPPLGTSVGNTRNQGLESQTRTACDENAGDGSTKLMEEVLRRENLLRAYKRVKSNKGAAGVDGMTVDELMPYCREHWDEIKEQLLEGTYQPRPVKRVEIPKPGGKGTRMLGIPVVLDRLIQQAILQVLTPIYDPTFSPNSHGFRPGRSTHGAILKAREYVNEGYDWVADLDLEKFFDRVNHDVMMSRIARRVKDKRLLGLIRRYLQAGMMEGGLVSPRKEGTPQGGPLSPLLSNILLDELDKELERRGHRFSRYADDFNVYVKSEAAGQRVMESLTKFLSKRLRLKVNQDKSAVDRPWNRKFLGYSFTDEKKPRTRVSPKSLERFKQKLKPIWKRGRGQSIKTTIKELNQIITGWSSYYRLSELIWPFKKLDSWIRRRIRCLIWRHWKTPRTRERNLRERGVPMHVVKAAVWAKAGPWKASNLPGMNMAFPNKTLKRWGLKSLFDEHRRFAISK